MLKIAYSDGGRSDAGFRTETQKDSLVCAVATLLNQPYHKWYTLVGSWNKRRGLSRSDMPLKSDIDAILTAAGLAKAIMPRGKWLTYTQAHEQHGDCIVVSQSRIYCIKAGRIYAKDDTALTYRKPSCFTDGKAVEVERKTRNIWVWPFHLRKKEAREWH